jgi:hypothetical protein
MDDVIRDFEDREAVLSLQENVVFNCTGLGAAALFESFAPQLHL